MKREHAGVYDYDYCHALRITDPVEAEQYFKALVDETLTYFPELTREQAIELEQINIGYWASREDEDTRERVVSLFGASYPTPGMQS